MENFALCERLVVLLISFECTYFNFSKAVNRVEKLFRGIS